RPAAHLIVEHDQQGIDISLKEAGIVFDEPSKQYACGQGIPALFLKGLELAHGVLEACRRVRQADTPCITHLPQRCTQTLRFVRFGDGFGRVTDSSMQRFIHSRSSLMAMVARLGSRSWIRVRSLTSPAS